MNHFSKVGDVVDKSSDGKDSRYRNAWALNDTTDKEEPGGERSILSLFARLMVDIKDVNSSTKTHRNKKSGAHKLWEPNISWHSWYIVVVPILYQCLHVFKPVLSIKYPKAAIRYGEATPKCVLFAWTSKACVYEQIPTLELWCKSCSFCCSWLQSSHFSHHFWTSPFFPDQLSESCHAEGWRAV